MWKTLFQDWRQQMSWGRMCAAVALAMAVLRECQGADVSHIQTWLGIATGNYAASKITEIFCSKQEGKADDKES
jgi:hypothetical protein